MSRALTSPEIREIGEALYGPTWQGAMARALGVPRQSVTYYLKSGVNGAQAAGIIGLIARVAFRERHRSWIINDQARCATTIWPIFWRASTKSSGLSRHQA